LDGDWQINDMNLTDYAGAAYIGSLELSAYADNDEFNPYQHVIYADIHNRLTEIYWQSKDKNITDLSASVPGPKPIRPTEFAGYAFGNLQNIFFSLETNLPGEPSTYNICSLQRFDDEWSFLNLSQIAKQISPQEDIVTIEGPTAFMTTDLPSGVNVLYIGDGADEVGGFTVNLLTQVNSEGPWTLQSLTTPSPPAVLAAGGQPMGASINPRLQAVHYCGFDGHLQQISWIGQTPNMLSYSNLTKPLGAPQVVRGSRPSSYVFPPDQSTHVAKSAPDLLILAREIHSLAFL
jgi:hypothetical protein